MTGIIGYGAGNVRSVSNALQRIGAPHCIASDIATLSRADRLILPGVGEARSVMDALERSGLVPWLHTVTVPFLGICIGMQVLFECSTERSTSCLGIIPGEVQRFDARERKVPHMGWNSVRYEADDPLFTGIAQETHFYFVHAYRAPVVPATIGRTVYGEEFSAAVRKENFIGVQFHAEKSGPAGLQLLKNFVTG